MRNRIRSISKGQLWQNESFKSYCALLTDTVYWWYIQTDEKTEFGILLQPIHTFLWKLKYNSRFYLFITILSLFLHISYAMNEWKLTTTNLCVIKLIRLFYWKLRFFFYVLRSLSTLDAKKRLLSCIFFIALYYRYWYKSC